MAAVSYRYVSINPDLQGTFGHYLHHDLRVQQEVESRGHQFISLSNREFTGADSDLRFLPLFSEPTWMIGRRAARPDSLPRFRDELMRGLTQIHAAADRAAMTIVYMYLGSSSHARMILDAIGALDPTDTCFVVNLFYAYHDMKVGRDPGPSLEREYRDLFRSARAVPRRRNVTLCVESTVLADRLAPLAGSGIPVFPLLSFTPYTSTELDTAAGTEAGGDGVTVCYPGTLQGSKGVSLLVGALKAGLAKEQGLRFVVREYAPEGVPPNIRDQLDTLRDDVTFVPGILSTPSYKQLFQQADIILIPYRKNPFFARTSAVFSDAMVLGKPVVSTKETWVGRETERLEVGATFTDGDRDAFIAAIRETVANLEHYRANARAASAEWLEQHEATHLVEFLRKCARSPLPPRRRLVAGKPG